LQKFRCPGNNQVTAVTLGVSDTHQTPHWYHHADKTSVAHLLPRKGCICFWFAYFYLTFILEQIMYSHSWKLKLEKRSLLCFSCKAGIRMDRGTLRHSDPPSHVANNTMVKLVLVLLHKSCLFWEASWRKSWFSMLLAPVLLWVGWMGCVTVPSLNHWWLPGHLPTYLQNIISSLWPITWFLNRFLDACDFNSQDAVRTLEAGRHTMFRQSDFCFVPAVPVELSSMWWLC
jgi:hypothetical protein